MTKIIKTKQINQIIVGRVGDYYFMYIYILPEVITRVLGKLKY